MQVCSTYVRYTGDVRYQRFHCISVYTTHTLSLCTTHTLSIYNTLSLSLPQSSWLGWVGCLCSLGSSPDSLGGTTAGISWNPSLTLSDMELQYSSSLTLSSLDRSDTHTHTHTHSHTHTHTHTIQDYNYPEARDRQYLNFFSKMANRQKFDVDK